MLNLLLLLDFRTGLLTLCAKVLALRLAPKVGLLEDFLEVLLLLGLLVLTGAFPELCNCQIVEL